ncbi:hypothetical protein [Bacillus anthracis]|nr:hypothetical protein [Bacillus thuringiensis]
MKQFKEILEKGAIPIDQSDILGARQRFLLFGATQKVLIPRF